MADTIRYRFVPQGSTDYSEDQRQVTDEEGYVTTFGDNEAKVVPFHDYSVSLAAGAVIVDNREQPARI